MIFVTVWCIARIVDVDPGTAADLLAGATTESASVGTATEALAHLGLEAERIEQLQANIGVTYAVTYLFGFTLVVFFVSTLAPRLMGIDLKQSATDYQQELGEVDDILGQEQALRAVLVRVCRVTNDEEANITAGAGG